MTDAPYLISDRVLERLGPGEIVTVTLDDLQWLFSLVDDSQRDELVRTVAALLDPSPFNARVGPWNLDVRRGALQTIVTAALVAVAARVVGIDSVPFAVLVATMPFVVDVDRVTLRPSDRVVLASLRSAEVGRDLSETLYDNLPVGLQHQLTRLEFVDVLERIIESGEATRDALGVIELRDEPYGRLVLPLAPDPDVPVS